MQHVQTVGPLAQSLHLQGVASDTESDGGVLCQRWAPNHRQLQADHHRIRQKWEKMGWSVAALGPTWMLKLLQNLNDALMCLQVPGPVRQADGRILCVLACARSVRVCCFYIDAVATVIV